MHHACTRTRRRRRLESAALTVLAATLLCVPAYGQALEIVKTDASEYPDVRLYVRASDADALAGATPRVEFEFQMAPDVAEARRFVDERRERARDRDKPFDGPELDDDPGNPVTASAAAFDEQSDPSEALLVVFAVDVSGSMAARSGTETALARVNNLVQSLLAPSGLGLRDIDRVALVTFADDFVVTVPPTIEHRLVTQRLERLDPKTGNHSTFLYDAVVNTLHRVVAAEPNPTLPGRRLVIVFSDGLDEGSSHEVGDIASVLSGLQVPTAVVTVGVGDPARDPDRHGDLNRIATFAGSGERFVEAPNAARLRDVSRRALETPRREFVVEFEVPVWFWTATPQRATLHFGREADAELTVPFQVAAARLTPEQASARAARVANDDAAVAWRTQTLDDERITRLAIGGGGGALALLLVIFATVRARRRDSASRQAELQSMQQNIEERIDKQVGEQSAQLLREAERTARQAADRERRPLALLSGLDGPLKGQRFGVLRTETVAGRDTEHCDLVLPADDPAISRAHAKFSLGAAGWEVLCMSDGGMTVNDARLRKGERYSVQFGDRLVLGRTTFEFGAAG